MSYNINILIEIKVLLWIYRKINPYLGDNYSLITVTAKISQEMKDKINGTVKFFFQPGEEVGKGAAAMVAEGALEGVDGVMGMHISSGLPSGTINADLVQRQLLLTILKLL